MTGDTPREDPEGAALSRLPAYSVLMSVYIKEDPAFLEESLASMLAQTVPPEEIVVVKDGQLSSELESVLNKFTDAHPNLFTIVAYPKNQGLGYALMSGVPRCRNEIIARMDSDDYAFPTRMEEELTVMRDRNLDMVGSQIVEFVEDPSDPVATSTLPVSFSDIVAFSKKRNPFRHPSMVFKKSKALEAGNYSPDFLYFEDWDLFNRMLARGCNAENIDHPLVAMRVSADFYGRRGGPAYLPHIWKFKTAQLRRGYFTFPQFLTSTIPHVIVCLVPNGVRSFIYTHLLRKGAK
nr:glycosyltransferase [Bifidobacterium ramosum]